MKANGSHFTVSNTLALLLVLPSAQAVTELDDVQLIFSGFTEPFAGFLEAGRVHLIEQDGARTFSLDMNEDGRTEPVTVEIGSHWDIIAEETPQSFGVALGQTIYGWQVEGPNGEHELVADRFEFTLGQPILRPAEFDSSVESGTGMNPALSAGIWDLYPDTPLRGQGYQFEGLAGDLRKDSLYRFFDYYGVEPAEPDYRYAWAIRTEGIEDFGKRTAILALQNGMAELEFERMPIVDLYFIADSKKDLGSSTFSVPGRACPMGEIVLSLAGKLGKGTTLVALRPRGDDRPKSHGLMEFAARSPDLPRDNEE